MLAEDQSLIVTARSFCIGRHGNTGLARRGQQYWRAQAQSLARRCASRSWSASQWCARRRRSWTLWTSSMLRQRSRLRLLPLQHRALLEGPHWTSRSCCALYDMRRSRGRRLEAVRRSQYHLVLVTVDAKQAHADLLLLP